MIKIPISKPGTFHCYYFIVYPF